ncbi:SGNH/GDSL hydrolase family protein [Beijerinckia mobilis]|uniref:SGNH/GDSL hydrolase family protein n=1 Tax=Beijerinckia mobilis TaxID=231434 RepID=UPI0005585971|nr:SGNH/GDSL hydrolase family protein [Beijerinckia mobilis]
MRIAGILPPLAIGTIAGVLAFYASWYLPALRWDGVASVSRTPFLPDIMRTISLRPGAHLICEGDSLTYGSRRLGEGLPPINGARSQRVETPYPETLARLLGHDIEAENRGYPGDRAQDGLRRWADKPSGDVVLLMYGTNDANPRGWRTAIPLADYQAVLSSIIRRHQQAGAIVIVLSPPAAGIAAAEAAIEPYRSIARRAAEQSGALFIDTRRLMADVAAPIQLDGLHLRAPATQAIAEGLAPLFSVSETTQ